MRALAKALIIGATFASPGAAAEEARQLLFSPPLSVEYLVEQTDTQTFEGGGVVRSERMVTRSALEFRQVEGAYEAEWTVKTTEGVEPFGHQQLLVDLPIVFTLGPQGEPVDVVDWQRLRRQLVQRAIDTREADLLDPLFYEGQSSRSAARMLMSPLLAIAPCHNATLSIGMPSASERESPIPNQDEVLVLRSSREVRSIDFEAGQARIVATFQNSVRGGGSDQLTDVTTMRTECAVDLQYGMVRHAVIEFGGEEASAFRRIEISISQ